MLEPSITLERAKEVVAEKTHPKITEEHIQSLIVDTKFLYDDLTTVAIITVENGFRFIGHSTPASPENYDRQVGERYAYDNAFKQIWTHEGYILKELLYQAELVGAVLEPIQ